MRNIAIGTQLPGWLPVPPEHSGLCTSLSRLEEPRLVRFAIGRLGRLGRLGMDPSLGRS